MIVDTSALVAILLHEPAYEGYAEILTAQPARISAASYFEFGLVIDQKRDPQLTRGVDDLMVSAEVTIEPVTERQARIAREAYRDYGKASGHPARLNFGDCFAYALARDLGEPLLFKGDDFRHTDIRPAIP
jgi:ribonuclease VapC